MWEFERRGYLKCGGNVPEVVLDNPELVKILHREFVHAGSDVVEAFTVSYVNKLVVKGYVLYNRSSLSDDIYEVPKTVYVS